ncbi:hypothetical protein [Luteolibacter sp. Populi]|uniref:hypothetical protein n=1 Tax=Luteolibacter sp. Populi TaxID=3230487 RepID=UPI003467C13C
MNTTEAIQRRIDDTTKAFREGKIQEEEMKKVLAEADEALKELDDKDPAAKPIEFESLETLDGKSYKSVKVTKVDAATISIRHESGTAKIPFEKLSEEMRTRFAYDPEAAAEQRRKAVEEARRLMETRKQAAEEKAAEARQAAVESLETQAARLREREAELARKEAELIEKEASLPQPDVKEPLDERIIRKAPEGGVTYPLPIKMAGLSFSATHGRKFVIPLRLSHRDNLQIRIRHGFDNSKDGGMKWELRKALDGKKLDAGFADEEGDYTVTVRNIPVRDIELVLTDDDTSFTGRDPGNGFKLSVSESD